MGICFASQASDMFGCARRSYWRGNRESDMSDTPKHVPAGYHTLTPYLIVEGAAKAIEFYKKAFGATEVMRLDGPNGRVGHAELSIGGSKIMLADEFPDHSAHGPGHFGGSPISLHLYVEDADESAARAVAAGATLTRPVEDQFYGDRLGSLKDPFGHVWHVAARKQDLSLEELKRRASAEAKKHSTG
jgi:PhnB protein